MVDSPLYFLVSWNRIPEIFSGVEKKKIRRESASSIDEKKGLDFTPDPRTQMPSALSFFFLSGCFDIEHARMPSWHIYEIHNMHGQHDLATDSGFLT